MARPNRKPISLPQGYQSPACAVCLSTSRRILLDSGELKSSWNSLSCDRAIAVLESVPAFLLAGTSAGPRASGEVRSGARLVLTSPRFIKKEEAMSRFETRRRSASKQGLCGRAIEL
jgi:hypothetical protein